MKSNQKKKLIFILLTIILSYISLNKIYIISNCKIPEKALKYHSIHNNTYNIKELLESNLVFASDDLVIYDIKTITKKDFEYEQLYTIKLKKEKNTWTLDSIDLKI
ncbi:MAG: hypothetical protein ACRCTZ_12250 [Sarcina sp.]